MPFIIAIPTSDNEGGDEGEDEGGGEGEPLSIAYVETAPLQVTSSESAEGNFTVFLSGHLLPLPGSLARITSNSLSSASASASASKALSAFLSTYLSSKPSTILISSPLFPLLPSRGDEKERDRKKKMWIRTVFPPPVPKPKILRDVTIKDMVIRPPSPFRPHSHSHLQSNSHSRSHLFPHLFPDLDFNVLANTSNLGFRLDTDMTEWTPSTNWVVHSGTVMAKIVLPKGMDVRIDVRGVLPDLLIFDGAVPPSFDGPVPPSFDGPIPPSFDGPVPPSFDGPVPVPSSFDGPVPPHEDGRKGMDRGKRHLIAPPLPPEKPLPSPIPPNAFAHIRPGEWLVASSEPFEDRDPGDGGEGGVVGKGGVEGQDGKGLDGKEKEGEGEEEEEGSVTFVRAQIVDVPLEVLPGRENDFGKFVRKVCILTPHSSPTLSPQRAMRPCILM